MSADRDAGAPPDWQEGDLARCIADRWFTVLPGPHPVKGQILKVRALHIVAPGILGLGLHGFPADRWYNKDYFARISPDVEPATEEFAGFLHAALAEHRRAQQERRP